MSAASAGAATGDVVVVSKPAFAPPLASFPPPGAGWVYLSDVKTGSVLDRLANPSLAERIGRTADRILVRAYDARVIVRLGSA